MFRNLLLPVLLAFTFVLGACTPNPVQTPAAAALAPTAASKPTEAPVFPLTLKDGKGREVTLETAPARIVSLSPSNTEILFAVGAGNLVVGDTKYCDYPAEAKGLPKVGGFTGKSISVESILALKPDLVLAADSGQETVIEALEQSKVKVLALKAQSFEEVYANLKLAGQITGHAQEAAMVVDTMQARVKAVSDKVAGIPAEKRPALFWEVWDEPLMTAGPNTFAGQMIRMAGGTSIFADVSKDYPEVSVEEVVKRNPAYILGPDSHGDKLIAKELAARPGWEQIDAVKQNKIFLIDGNSSSRPGPRLVDALEAIAKALHPDLFK
jgi:iron complex transport system substrate-binding protein